MCLLFAQFPYAHNIAFTTFFSPHSSARISESCSCTRLVSTYIVALFQCFRMVPVSCSSGGANKNVHQKTAPLSNEVRLKHPYTTASLHEAVRTCNLKRWISTLDSLVYTTAGKVGAYSFLFAGKRL